MMDSLVIGPSLDRYEPAKGRLHRCDDRPPFVLRFFVPPVRPFSPSPPISPNTGMPTPKIYTKTGDAGETSFFDNSRVSKADPRVDAYGEVDEVNACLGAALAAGVDAD